MGIAQRMMMLAGGAVMVSALGFGTNGDRYSSAALSFFTETPRTVRLRTRFTSVPSASGTDQIAGFSFSATGWLVSLEDTISGILNTRCVTFYMATGPGQFTLVARKPITTAMLGATLTWHMLWDGTKARVFLDGREIGRGFCNAGNPFGYSYTEYDPPTVGLGIGARGADGAFRWTSGQFIELAVSTTALTRAQILSDAATTPGTAMLGEVHRYTPVSSTGATLVDSTGSINLTRTGTPANSSVTYLGGTVIRTWRMFGDSIMAGRQVGNTSGDGYRRGAFNVCANANLGVSIVGSSAPNASANPDYDFWMDAVAGETLQTRLLTLPTDLSRSAPDIGIMANYAINDLVGGRTAAQVQGDYVTWCSICQSSCPGSPIVIANVTSISTSASGYTPAVGAQIALYQSGYAAMVTGLQGMGFNVISCDYSGIITDPEDPAQLYDGTHYTPATYALASPIVGASLMVAA